MQTNVNQFGWKIKFGNQRRGHVSSSKSLSLLLEEGGNSFESHKYPILVKKVSSVPTSAHPKHVNTYKNKILVSCMSEGCVDVYRYKRGIVTKKSQIIYDKPCIHSILKENVVFTTISTLKKHKSDNYLSAFDLKSCTNTIIKTHGKWSKYIKAHPNLPLVYISNWKSNSISIFSIKKPLDPVFIKSIPCGISPRGMDITKDGKKLLVACYYSRNIVEFEIDKNGLFAHHIGTPYNYPKYSGNLRGIKVDENNKHAFITNMGRGELIRYDINNKSFTGSAKIGHFPTSLIHYHNLLLITCSASNLIYVVNKNTLSVVGVSETTSRYPVSIACDKDGNIFTVSYYGNLLEVWNLENQKIQTQGQQTAKHMS